MACGRSRRARMFYHGRRSFSGPARLTGARSRQITSTLDSTSNGEKHIISRHVSRSEGNRLRGFFFFMHEEARMREKKLKPSKRSNPVDCLEQSCRQVLERDRPQLGPCFCGQLCISSSGSRELALCAAFSSAGSRACHTKES